MENESQRTNARALNSYLLINEMAMPGLNEFGSHPGIPGHLEILLPKLLKIVENSRDQFRTVIFRILGRLDQVTKG